MPNYAIDGIRPVVHPQAYVHPSATLIGDVIIAENCYIGPSAVLRGDFGRLIMEQGANLQDTCVVHGFPDTDTTIEEDGHIGHGAIIHGCHIGKNALIGMNSVIMDNAVIGESAVVAAMSFVKAGLHIPARHLAVGSPAKIVREMSDDELAWKQSGTRDYQTLVRRSHASLIETTPLSAVEAGRQRMQLDCSIPLSQLNKQQSAS